MLITKKLKLWSVILACFCLFFNSAPVLAAESPWLNAVKDNGLGQIGNTSFNTDKPKDLRAIVVEFIQIILGLLGIIFVSLILMGGYRWMTAAGNQDKVEAAQQTLTKAIIGLLIILASYSITWFITRRAVWSVIDTEHYNFPTDDSIN